MMAALYRASESAQVPASQLSREAGPGVKLPSARTVAPWIRTPPVADSEGPVKWIADAVPVTWPARSDTARRASDRFSTTTLTVPLPALIAWAATSRADVTL